VPSLSTLSDSASGGFIVDLRELVGHGTWVPAHLATGEVFDKFVEHGYDFIGVIEKDTVLGLCSKRDVGMLLGSKYGFSLFAPKPIGGYLLAKSLCIRQGTPIEEVFAAVFSREEGRFFDDVILLGRDGKYIGLIYTQTLVKLQNRIHLESIRLLEEQACEIQVKNAQIEEDLRMSRELQQALLPVSYPKFVPRLSAQLDMLCFHHYYHPLRLVGGDFFHVEKVSETAAGVFIADVMGHGGRSAIITAMLRALLEELVHDEFKDPAGLLSHINHKLTRILQQAGNGALYATALYVLIDAETQVIRHASAGHPAPVHLRRRQGRAISIEHPNPGTVLGVFEGMAYFNHETAYEPGDSLIVYTDGIVEVENASGHEFGLASLCESVTDAIGLPTPDIFQVLTRQALDFAWPGGFADDVCLVGIDLG
jgi:serine phosphatase RsbU (regulator of sigma subunit)